MKLNSLGRWNKSTKLATLSLAAFVVCVLVLLMTVWWAARQQRIVCLADSWAHNCYSTYQAGSFDEATNALTKYIHFLKANQRRLSGYREIHFLRETQKKISVYLDTDRMLGIAHRHLGYMLLFTDDAVSAFDHFQAAYEYYLRQRVPGWHERVPKAQFVEWVIGAREKMDAMYGAAWKSNGSLTLNSNTLSKVKALFAEDQ